MRVIIATGGTGGHIYPAISLAQALKDKSADNEILFIGTDDHMEARIIPETEFAFKSINVSGFSGNIFNHIKAAYQSLLAINSAKKIITEFKADIIIGFGSYISVPVLLAAKKLRIPTMIHEQNAYAGRANLYLAKFVDAIVVSYKESLAQFKNDRIYHLGNPRVYQIKDQISTTILDEYGLDKEKPIILIVMGSQGSASINRIMKDVLRILDSKDYQIVYVTGKAYYESFKEKNKYKSHIHILPFVKQSQLLPYVDLIITRGGATTATEICAFGVSSIIIPSPFVPNNHQEINAQALVNKKAASMIKEKQLEANLLINKIDELMENNQLRQIMSANAKSLSLTDAAEKIIELMNSVVDNFDKN